MVSAPLLLAKQFADFTCFEKSCIYFKTKLTDFSCLLQLTTKGEGCILGTSSGGNNSVFFGILGPWLICFLMYTPAQEFAILGQVGTTPNLLGSWSIHQKQLRQIVAVKYCLGTVQPTHAACLYCLLSFHCTYSSFATFIVISMLLDRSERIRGKYPYSCCQCFLNCVF